MLSLAEE
jgi:hypothetical protein